VPWADQGRKGKHIPLATNKIMRRKNENGKEWWYEKRK